jgi:protoporphyrinogen oxidase
MTEQDRQDEAFGGISLGPADQVVVIGGGPAGLSAAYELTKLGLRPVVIEKGNQVGGIARTENYKGYYFDMGGHRFFTKSKEVNDMWREVLGPDFLRRPRLSRIYYRKRFLYYPLRPLNALGKLGPLYGVMSILSYIRWQLFPYPEENTFEQWVTNRFGRRLFLTFFKSYTEKVWGIPTNELSAEWAAQRIKNLSLGNAIVSMFIKPQGKITSLIEEFDYPRLGPGMMWKAVQACIEARGGQVILNAEVVRVCRDGNRITGVVIRRADGCEELIEGTHLISSMALREFIQRIDSPPPAVLEAVEALHYREFLTVCLIVDQPDLFPDNWIYIHDPEVKVGRIQNFKNWSPEMVPDPSKTSLGLEYFCNEGDEFWTMPDAELVEQGKRELETMGLARAADVVDGCVFRVEKAYPVYDGSYREYLNLGRGFVESLENFATIGRNGLHRYNNQDHAMLTGMYAVRNLFFGEQNDLWRVNAEEEYQEEIKERQAEEIVARTLKGGLPKLDPVAYGVGCGLAGSLLLFLAAFLTFAQGGLSGAEPGVALLGQFLPYYDLTLGGSLLGLVYGFLLGFGFGWLFALVRNVSVLFSIAAIERTTKMRLFWKVLY